MKSCPIAVVLATSFAVSFVSGAALAEPFDYRLFAGTITGTLGTTAFTDATYRIDEFADTANVTSFQFMGQTVANNIGSPVTITISDATTTVSAILLRANPALSSIPWHVQSSNITGTAGIGFTVYSDVSYGTGLPTPDGLADLTHTLTVSGTNPITSPTTFSTDQGTLTVTAVTAGAATFDIIGVAEPASGLVALGAMGGLAVARRRPRR